MHNEEQYRYEQFLKNNVPAWSVMQEHLKKATQEGKAAAADLCSLRLEKLANHAANTGLSAAEIVELIREEAAAIESKGGAAWN